MKSYAAIAAKHSLSMTMRSVLSNSSDMIIRQKPTAPITPPPVVPVEPVEVLEPGQLLINASEWELRNASPIQLLDFLKRARPVRR
jgi:hypothetical protein